MRALRGMTISCKKTATCSYLITHYGKNVTGGVLFVWRNILQCQLFHGFTFLWYSTNYFMVYIFVVLY